MKTFKTALLADGAHAAALFLGAALGGRGGITIALIFAIIMKAARIFSPTRSR